MAQKQLSPDEVAAICTGAIDHYLRQFDEQERRLGEQAVEMFQRLRAEMPDDAAKYKVVIASMAKVLRV